MPELLAPPSDTPAPLHVHGPLELGHAPVDEFGFPYPIHPYSEESFSGRTNDHHSFYRRRAPELQDLAGRAVRYSRCLTVSRSLHDRFHAAFPEGVERLPQSQQEKFGIAVLAVAGYLPKSAVDVRNAKAPELVPMNKNTYDFVRGQRQMHFETRFSKTDSVKDEEFARRNIGKFFASYVQRQDMTGISQRDIRDFLSSGRTERRRSLGIKILREAIEMATEPINPLYGQALEEGLVKRVKPSAAEVVKLAFPEDVWPDYFQPLRRNLLRVA